MFILIENGEIHRPEYVGKGSVLLRNSAVCDGKLATASKTSNGAPFRMRRSKQNPAAVPQSGHGPIETPQGAFRRCL